MSELVFSPAQMTTATYAQPEPGQAAPAHVDGRQVRWHLYPEQAAAGLWSTPTDLLRFARAIQAAITAQPRALLPQETALAMIAPQITGWGLGLMLSGDGPHRRFSHGGGNHGYQCAFIATTPAATPPPS